MTIQVGPKDDPEEISLEKLSKNMSRICLSPRGSPSPLRLTQTGVRTQWFTYSKAPLCGRAP